MISIEPPEISGCTIGWCVCVCFRFICVCWPSAVFAGHPCVHPCCTPDPAEPTSSTIAFASSNVRPETGRSSFPSRRISRHYALFDDWFSCVVATESSSSSPSPRPMLGERPQKMIIFFWLYQCSNSSVNTLAVQSYYIFIYAKAISDPDKCDEGSDECLVGFRFCARKPQTSELVRRLVLTIFCNAILSVTTIAKMIHCRTEAWIWCRQCVMSSAIEPGEMHNRFGWNFPYSIWELWLWMGKTKLQF